MTVLAIAITFAVAAMLARRFCNPASRLHILDHPNERSLHAGPVPRTGGIAVLGGLAAGAAILLSTYPGGDLGWVLLSGLPVAAASFLDDRFGLSPGSRIVAHLLAAALLLAGGIAPGLVELPGLSWAPPAGLVLALALIYTVWMINLYNFMDGMDGFAGGMAVFGFATLALLGAQAGADLFCAAALLVAGAAAGFLPFNWPPARIFLGDTGSSSLGFLAAAFSLWGSRDGLLPLWVALLIFSPFIVDATVTLARRTAAGERIWTPHNTHYYQRLVRLGWGHRRTMLAGYGLMAGCSLSALLAVHLPAGAQLGLAAAWLLLYTILMVAVGRLERQHPTMVNT